MLEGRGATPVIVYGWLGDVYLLQGDLERAITVYEQGLALCRVSGNQDSLRGIIAGLGYAYALQGRIPEGRALLEEAFQEVLRTGAMANHSLRMARLSEVCPLAGQHDEALGYAHQALDAAQQHRERANEVFVLYQLGVVYAYTNPPENTQAAAYYRQALALAEELGMRPLQAHCHFGLGTLYAKTGRREQARAELSTAMALYHTMDMTFWLPQAEATLVQMG